MTLTELRYIVAVARERHFGRAAEACFVSQPTLSVAVRKLEEELGVTLFERARGEVSSTPIGERIVAQARQVLAEAAVIPEIAAAGRDGLAGPLRLGAIYTIGPYLFPHLIPIIRERVPQMTLLVEENYTAGLAAKLKGGELDVIVVALPFEQPGVITAPLYDEPFVVLLPASHPLALQAEIEVGQLEHETVLLLGQGHCFREQVIDACPTCITGATDPERGLQQTLEGSSLETIRYMVAGGVGVTVLPCTATGADHYAARLVKIRRFKGIAPSRRVGLAWRASFPRPEAVEALRAAITAAPLTCVTKLGPETGA